MSELKSGKHCIFDSKKVCDDCGECYICDLDPKKKCNNCGKCLELEGYDVKAIKLDEIIEDEEEIKEYQNSKDTDETDEDSDNDSDKDSVEWEFIDDIKDIKQIMEDENTFKEEAYEEFPGLIRLKKGKDK